MKMTKKGLGYWLLTILKNAEADGIVDMFSYSAQMKYIKNLSNLQSKGKATSLSKTIQRLKKHGFIDEERNIDGGVYLKLSLLGKRILYEDKEWDGIYRIIVWDIPEKKRRLRDLLRRKLKEWDFRQIQKSVWISKRNATSQLRELINELEMDKWVVVIESDDSTLGTFYSTIVE